MFTLLGFMGIYMVLGILTLFLIRREIEQGPAAHEDNLPAPAAAR
jgi:cytochrome bd-type quinol oxidase subunit 1